ncbi:MAG: ATP-binding protein [Pseudonocardia sp.]|nr:ATP-binding protein [Pseudonocardia sp.]
MLRGAGPEMLVDAELVCTELVTNAVEHAAGPRSVRVAMADEDLRIEVDDASPEKPLTPGVSRLGGMRGRGLVIVDAVTRWGIDRGRSTKTVWAAIPRT